MASSGIKVSDESITIYNQLKSNTLNSETKILYFKIGTNSEGGTVMKIDRESPHFGEKADDDKERFEKFKSDLLANYAEQPLFIVYDFPFLTKENQTRKKLILISWSPDTAKVKPKMMYAASKDTLMKGLGINKDTQVNDGGDLDYDELHKSF